VGETGSTGPAGPSVWGGITGTLSTQTDLQAALDAKATKSQTDYVSVFIASPSDKTYKLIVKSPLAMTITNLTTVCISGTCTVTGKINTTALGGTANSASSSETTQAHSSANSLAVGDDLQITISSNSSCVDLSITFEYTRTLA